MKKALKIIGIVIAFLITSVVVLALLVDPNMFKPRIETLAKQQGIALNMRGDLHWAFWPSIGIAVEEVSVADVETPKDLIAQVKKASFMMAFIPLMRGDFEVKHVVVDGAAIDLIVNEKGVGNWENLIKEKEKTANINSPKTSASVRSEDLDLSIEKISLKNSNIIYVNKMKSERMALKDIDLDMDDVNVKGEPFATAFSGTVEYGQTEGKVAPLVVKVSLNNNLALGQGFNSVAVSDGKLKLDIGASKTESLTLKYGVNLSDIKTTMNYKGNIAVDSFNAKKLLAAFNVHPKMASEKAMTDVSLSSNFSGNKTQILLDQLVLTLDQTQLKGTAAITDFASSALKLNLQGTSINVDHYLAAEVEDKAPPETVATGNEPLIPVETIKKLNADISVAFAKIIISELTLEKIQFDLDAKNGAIQQQLNASAYSGNIHHKTSIEARGQTAYLRFESVVQGVEVAPILKDKKLDKSMKLSGAIQANANGQATGITQNQILDTLTGGATFSGEKMQLAPINIEQQFCQLITLVNKAEEPAKTWEAFTQLRELTGKITIANRVITIDTLNAGVEKLLLGSTGNIHLGKGTYDFSLPLKLIRDANDTPVSITTSKDGCVVNSNYWAERSMSLLRCKGSYAEINPKQDCRPDKNALVALTKDYAEYKVREKYGDKIDAKKSELQKKLDEKLGEKLGGEGGSENAKDLLKNMFKKKSESSQSSSVKSE